MKKRLISLFCAFLIVFTVAAPSFALTAEEQYKNMTDIIDLIQERGLTSSKDDDPLRRGLLELFKQNPTAYDALMNAMLGSYDRYSNFVSAGNYDVTYPSNASYVGVGVTLEEANGFVRIAAVAPGGSAAKAGVMVGDILQFAGGKNVRGWSINDVSPILRGDAGTKVEITVTRGDVPLTFVLTRAKITIENFEGKQLEEGIYYMKIAQFAETTTFLKFMVSIREMAAAQTKSLILDLRGNPGGEVDMALNMVNRLAPDADKVFFTINSRENDSTVTQEFRTEGFGPRLNKIIILADGGSASASEIMQSSLCDLGYAEAVGQKTYGKARGQYHVVFDDGSAVVLTGLSLIPPSGKDYDTVGLAPKYPVENSLAPHPAATAQKLAERFLNITNWSEDTRTLNSALTALGFLSLEPTDDIYNFGTKTRDALNEFRSIYGIAPQDYLDVATAQKINSRLADFANVTVSVDNQMNKALELAREYTKQPLQYTLDKDGNYTNIEK